MPQKELSGRLRDVLNTAARLESAGEFVTLHRIGSELNLPRQNIWSYVHALQKRGLLVYAPTERFTTPIHLSDLGWQSAAVSSADRCLELFHYPSKPLAEGSGIVATRIEGTTAQLSDFLVLEAGDFLLQVHEDSMIGIGIYPTDYVAIHPNSGEILNGDIVLVDIPGENSASLRRWQQQGGMVTLHSENASHDPVTFPVNELMVHGCMVGHIGTSRSRRASLQGSEGEDL